MRFLNAGSQTIGLIFGPTAASVTGANAPVLATTGVNVAGVCYQLPGGQFVDFKLTKQPPTFDGQGAVGGNGPIVPTFDRFVGFVGAGATNLVIFQASPQ